MTSMGVAGITPQWDQRLISKPPSFSGGPGESWDNFKFQSENCFGLCTGTAVKRLKMAENSTAEIPQWLSDPNEEAENKIVYSALASILQGKPLAIVKRLTDRGGFEAWRLLNIEYEPGPGNRQLAWLDQINRVDLTAGNRQDIDGWIRSTGWT